MMRCYEMNFIVACRGLGLCKVWYGGEGCVLHILWLVLA
jgi:hypothetical protein